MTLKIQGKIYPVTAGFRQTVLDPHPDLAAMRYADLIAQRDELLKLSTLRNSNEISAPAGADMDSTGNLTKSEAARLANVTHVINCHNAVNFLAGRSHTEFGFEGIDQVHGNRCHHPCGCVTQHVFDHHRRIWDPAKKEQPPELHAHFSRASCDRHKPLFLNFKEHRAAVLADNAEADRLARCPAAKNGDN